MKKPATIVIASSLALGLGACSSTASSQSSPQASATSASPSSTQAPAPTNATAVIEALKAKGLPVTLTITYTAETDKNHKLGRPGEYTSKASFTDSRIKKSQAQDTAKGSVDLGGSVEQYPDQAGAVDRAKYIQQAIKSTGFLAGEYDFASGGALLRLSSILTPAQAEQYKVALGEIMGAPVEAIAPPKS